MKEQKRYLLIDGIRGLAIVNMVAFHFLYDVNEIWNINSHWYEEKSIHIWQQAIWWGDMPQPLFTFLEEYDFSEKTIIPFNSHGGSGFSNTIEEIKELQPDANISDEGLSISRDKVADSVQDVTDWAKSLDLSEK